MVSTKRLCVKYNQNFDLGNTAGFFTMTKLLHIRHTFHAKVPFRNKTPLVPQPPYISHFSPDFSLFPNLQISSKGSRLESAHEI